MHLIKVTRVVQKGGGKWVKYERGLRGKVYYHIFIPGVWYSYTDTMITYMLLVIVMVLWPLFFIIYF